MVSLDQCDLRRTVMLNPASKRYRVQPYPAPVDSAAGHAPDAFATPPSAPRRGGVITLTNTLSDTLERQMLFGLEARHIHTVVTKQTAGEVCDKSPLRVEIDTWYVDLPSPGAGCSPPPAPEPEPAADATCQDRVETRVVGDVVLGFPVKAMTTTTGGDDAETTATTSVEVTALEITRLDAAIFDIPADFQEARSPAELVPALASGGSLADALLGSTADGTSTAAPKKPGVTRIGVLEPLNRSERALPTRLLRTTLVGKFTGGSYEALALAGSSAPDIDAEAARLQCDYILVTELTEVKSSKAGKLGGLMKMASGGGPPKDSHEVKMQYRLFATGAPTSPRIAGEARASSGGFGVGSALRLAAFAGQMYVGMGGMGLMRGGFGGFGMGLMGPLAGMAGPGSMAGALFDPRTTALSSMAMSMGGFMTGMPGAPDPSTAEVIGVVSEAFEAVAKASEDKLEKAGR